MSAAGAPFAVVGVVGAGPMGSGIAALAAGAGARVLLHDVDARRLAAAIEAIGDRAVVAAAAPDELASAQLVVEAVTEDLDVKRSVLRALDEAIDDDAVLASNTSSLSISLLARATRCPERVVGLHFFNPVARMRVVEVVPGHATRADVLERCEAFVERLGHRAVRAADAPGFIVNHAGRAMVTEGLRILEEGVTDPATLDLIVREGAGFPMGPCELMDLTGLDVSHAVMESIFEQHYQDPRYRPSTLALRRVRAGMLGRKTGEGFYRHPRDSKGRALAPTAEPAALRAHESVPEVWRAVIDRAASGAGASAVLVVAPLGDDATTFVTREGLPPERTVALDPLLAPDRMAVLMGTPATAPDALGGAAAALHGAGVRVAVVDDSPGFVAQRILAMIVNTGAAIAEAGIASPAAIDEAVALALGYPRGPFALGDQLGAATVHRVLEGLLAVTRDPRYRPTPWLRRRAQLGLSLSHSR